MKINIATSWADITLKQFDELLLVSNNGNLTDIEREIKIVTICTGLSEEEVNELNLDVYNTIVSKLSFLSKPITKKMPSDTLKIGGEKYKVDMFMGKISAGQFLDYQVISSRNDIDKRAARLLACFTYPKKAKYNDGSYDVDELVDKIYNNVSVEEVTAYTDFFMLEYKALSAAILQSLRHKIQKSKGMSEQEKQLIQQKLEQGEALINSFGTSE